MEYLTTQDGLRLAYDLRGEGVPLLCLAGLTRNMEDFDPVLPALEGRAQVIRMDYRGRGASDWGDPARYQIPQEAADALALLDHLGIARAAILGTSRGGLIAMTLAVMAPGRLSGAILNDIGPVLQPEGLAHIMDYLGRPPSFDTLAEAAAALPVAHRGRFANVAPEAWAAMARRLYAEVPGDGLALRYDPALRDAVAPAFAPGAETPDLWPLFDALAPQPLGAIRGANSDLLSPETLAEMRRRRPDMIAAEVPDRGHVPFLDEPEAVEVIHAVLAQVAEAERGETG